MLGNATRLPDPVAILHPNTAYDLVFNKCLLERIHFTIEQKMMLSIRERAEAYRS